MHYEHEETSFNYRLSNLLAAIGRGQLRTLLDRVQKTQTNLQYYQNNMKAFPGIEFMPGPSDGHSTRWLDLPANCPCSIRMRPGKRESCFGSGEYRGTSCLETHALATG